MIVVTGATGQLGRAIVENLLARTSAAGIAVSVREPEKAQDLASKGVRVRKGDFGGAASLREAFEGATQVLMVSSNARAYGGDPIAQHRTAIDAAKAAGVKRILYTSQISASPTSAFSPGLDHAKTEVMLGESGVAFTSLRNGFYASHAAGVVANAIKKGGLVVPENGKLSWTAHADLAEAAAVILLSEGRFEGATPPLTGAEALDFKDVAVLASELAGREIKYSTICDDDFIAHSMFPAGGSFSATVASGLHLGHRGGVVHPAALRRSSGASRRAAGNARRRPRSAPPDRG